MTLVCDETTTQREVVGRVFRDGDKIYLNGAVKVDVEREIQISLRKSGAKVAVVRQR